MAVRLLGIFLAFAVGLTNAICVCAAAPAPFAPASHENTEGHAHACCGDHDGDAHDEHHDGRAPANHGGHDCSHCTGAGAVAQAPADHPAIPGLSLAATFLFIPEPPHAGYVAVLGAPRDHSGLPPPLAPPTLLNLGCSLNT